MNVENARYDINEDGVAVVRMDTANSKVIKQFFTSYNINRGRNILDIL